MNTLEHTTALIPLEINPPSAIEASKAEQPSFLKRICSQVKSAVSNVYQKGADYLAAKNHEMLEKRAIQMEKELLQKADKGSDFFTQMRELQQEDRLADQAKQYEEKLLQQAEKQPSFFEQMRELKKEEAREQQIQEMGKKLLRKAEELEPSTPSLLALASLTTSFQNFIQQTGRTFAKTLTKKALPAILGLSTFTSTTGLTRSAQAAAPSEFISAPNAEIQTTPKNTWDKPEDRNQLRTNLKRLVRKNPTPMTFEAQKSKANLENRLKEAYRIEKPGTPQNERQKALESAKQAGNDLKKLINPNYQIVINDENPFPNIPIETGNQRNGARLAVIQYLAKFHAKTAQEKETYDTLRKALRFCIEVETGEYRRAHPEIEAQPTAKQAVAYMLQQLKKIQKTKTELPDQVQKIKAKGSTNLKPILQPNLPKASAISEAIKTNPSVEQTSLNTYEWDLIVTSVKDVIALILEIQPKDSNQLAVNLEKQEKENKAIINLKWEKNGKLYTNGIVIKPKMNAKVEHGLCSGDNATITLVNKEKPTFNSLLQAAQSVAYNWQ